MGAMVDLFTKQGGLISGGGGYICEGDQGAKLGENRLLSVFQVGSLFCYHS